MCVPQLVCITMKIVVNHLTRMQEGYMCVAGIDLDTGLHVRPVLDRQMRIDMLSVHGGVFDIARIIDLGETRFVGRVPEIEDRWFNAGSARHVGDMAGDQFWTLLEKVSQQRLGAIFGPDLECIGSTCALAEARGLRSLGCYWAPGGKLLLDEKYDRRRIRFSWHAGGHFFNAPVTDIRLYSADHITPCEDKVRCLSDRLQAQPQILVSVGLSRPYRKLAGDPPRHWLQINNFHLSDEPCWTLGG
jgi:hypothetical protein